MSFPVRTPHLHVHSVAWYGHKINRPECTENRSISGSGALFGHGAASELSSLCALERTFADASRLMGSRLNYPRRLHRSGS